MKLLARITIPECGVQLDCMIKHVNDDIYRICEHPTFAEDQVLYADCVRMLKLGDQNYDFQ
ncbi:hypothetical protein GCM10007939_22650 [Amylibacter marinus]|uniref:Uncharacterized protein n=1 Tax=Amylibacter marinus TaxID=1475483 RepID=A0ABQ5VY21_9RHOB|nr:hypothetical protein GCM10007939_22650 [Amylibacter marinus]